MADEWADFTPEGKRTITEQGYVIVRCPGHPNANKGKKGAYIYEHRLVMSNHLKRPLARDEVVHHLNGNKSDNRIENLELLTAEEHMKLHGENMPVPRLRRFTAAAKKYAESRKKPRELIPCACGCGTVIEQYDSKGRPRRFAHGHNQTGRRWKWGEAGGI